IAAHPGTDNTTPTVFVPQRYPYNPGGTGFGPNYSYQQHQNSSDFHVWTFAYDVSGVQSAVLKYRLDNDGTNPLSNNDNETYAGGSGVGSWQSIPMTYRNFPTGNVTGNPDINFFILPDYIAGEYYAEIAGIAEKLVDYYVEVTDNQGNLTKTAIQHVVVGPSNPGGGGQNGVFWTPSNPTLNDVITITQTDVTVGAKLHWGVNTGGQTWQTPDNAYWPAGSYLFNGSGPAIESAMDGPDAENNITIQLGPFNNPDQVVNAIDFVIHYDNNTWNNNNGADFHIPINNAPTAVNYQALQHRISLWPVPANDILFVGVPVEFIDGHRLIITAMGGQTAMQMEICRENFSIDVSRLESGVYNVAVLDENGTVRAVSKAVIR
ncbi:MAG: igtZ, partial [Bacteroidetes bacterium]